MPKFFFFLKDRQLYRQEISLKVVFQILQLVISSEMVCLNILEGGVFMYVCLVSPTHGSWLYSWNILSIEIHSISKIIFLTWNFFLKWINVKCWNSFFMTWKETSVRWWHWYAFTCWWVSRLGILEHNHWIICQCLLKEHKLLMQRRKKSKKSLLLPKKVELIYPRHWTTWAHKRWILRKLAVS
jgi:hypothetical protein